MRKTYIQKIQHVRDNYLILRDYVERGVRLSSIRVQMSRKLGFNIPVNILKEIYVRKEGYHIEKDIEFNRKFTAKVIEKNVEKIKSERMKKGNIFNENSNREESFQEKINRYKNNKICKVHLDSFFDFENSYDFY